MREPSVHIQEEREQSMLVESISPNVLRDEAEMTAEMSNQVTLYDEEGFELRDVLKVSDFCSVFTFMHFLEAVDSGADGHDSGHYHTVYFPGRFPNFARQRRC